MNESEPLEYYVHETESLGSVFECKRCSAVVIFRNRHTDWHRELQRVVDSLTALTRILVPEAPPGHILEPHTVIPGTKELSDDRTAGTN